MSYKDGDAMIRIAIVDDEKSAIESLMSNLMEIEADLDEKLQIFSYSSGSEFLKNKIRYNIVFLDIEMPGINGIEIAKEIRKNDSNVQIVYVTNYRQYWRNAYQVHAFQYIEKPYDTEIIRQVLMDYFKIINDSVNKTMSFTLDNGRKIMLPINQIIYISCGVKKRQVIVIAENNEYICKGMISDLFLELNDMNFFMPHRSHIINFDHLKYYGKDWKLVMSNDDTIPLAKGKTKEFEKYFARSLHYKVSRCMV